jgi:thiol:disulfide interchange protein
LFSRPGGQETGVKCNPKSIGAWAGILMSCRRDEPLSLSRRCSVTVSRISLIASGCCAVAMLLGCTPKSEEVEPAAKATVEPQAVATGNDHSEAKTLRKDKPRPAAAKARPALDSKLKSEPAAQPAIQWAKDWPSAQKAAADSGKLIMVDFYTDWCGWCKRLDRDTFPNKTVVDAARNFISLRLNAEKEGRPLARKHGVRGYPTIMFFDHTGKLVGRIGGYLKPAPFAATMKKILDKHKTS